MDFLHPYTFLITLLLLSWSSSTPPPPPPPSSAHAAAEALRSRGYSLFASTISTTTNFSGTIFVPPDFVFSSSTAKILTTHPPPPRPSTNLLLYHTLTTPLTWFNLSTTPNNGVEIPTLYNNNCLFLFKTSTGEMTISSTRKPNGLVVKIRQPDIYVDDDLTVHGIDGVLDPTSATQCTSVKSQETNPLFLDHAIKALRRRRFTVAATGLTIKKSELLTLTSVTIFAPSDLALFSSPNGFRYDFRHHVVPKRYRFGELATLTVLETLAVNKTVIVDSVDGVVTVDGVSVNGTEVYRNKWIVVLSVSMSLDDAVDLLDSGSFSPSPAPAIMEIQSPSPAPMDFIEPMDFFNGTTAGIASPSPAPVDLIEPMDFFNGTIAGIASPSPAPVDIIEPMDFFNGTTARIASPSPAPVDFIEPMDFFNSSIAGVPSPSPAPIDFINGSIAGVQSLSPASTDNWNHDERSTAPVAGVQAPSTVENEVIDPRCVFGIPVWIEGGDLFCGPRPRHLQEMEDHMVDGHVSFYAPLDVKDQLSAPLISNDESNGGTTSTMDSVEDEQDKMNISIDENHKDHINIADDLFFYF